MTGKQRVAIASDHAGYELKEYLKTQMSAVDWVDKGPFTSARVDYPDYAAKAARQVTAGSVDRAVLVCGSGIGMCIAANKLNGVRAAVVESEQTARLSREHNNANILCLGARILEPQRAKTIVEVWLSAVFEGGRHADRIQKISDLEKCRTS